MVALQENGEAQKRIRIARRIIVECPIGKEGTLIYEKAARDKGLLFHASKSRRTTTDDRDEVLPYNMRLVAPTTNG